MSEQVRVNRNVVFAGVANTTNNVEGNMNPDKRYRAWEFEETVLDATNQYTLQLDTNSTIAVGSGGAIFTTHATDNKVATMGLGGVTTLCAQNPVVEFRFQLNDVENVAIFAGLTDSADEGAATMPFALSVATLTSTASDAAGFLFDTDQTLDYWNIVNVKANTDAFTQLASTYTPAAATDVVLRVALDTIGKAYYYYNGVQVGVKANATTAATALIPFFGIKNMSATSHVATLKYVRLWRDM
jgi:hypothetical protein